MKKQLIITLIDGTKITEDLNPTLKGNGNMAINVAANDPAILSLCATIAMQGYSPDQDEKYVKHIAPSQILQVEVKFS